MIDGTSGCDLISYSYSKNGFDVNIITGMFKALEMFINHLAYSDSFEQLEEINFQGLRIIYERYGSTAHPILCVGISKKQESIEIEHILLKHILFDFYQNYTPYFTNFVGDVVPFRTFKVKLEDLEKNWQDIADFYGSNDSDEFLKRNVRNYRYPQAVTSPNFPKFMGFQKSI